MLLLMFLLASGSGNDCFTALYERLKRKLLYTAKLYLKDRAEDAVHDVFQKLWIKYENNLEELCDKPDAFFVTITKNHCIDILRKEKHFQYKDVEEGMEDTVFLDKTPSPEAKVVVKDEVKRLRHHLEHLKPMYREMLEYKYLLSYSNTEIAEELGISASLVSTRLERALKQMRERFEEEDVL